jgi:anti-sigma factor RsiW
MTADSCREWRESLGAFVLDQLPPDEHAAVAAHLEGCSECRAELALLKPVAQALLLADPEHVEAKPSPPRSLAYRVFRGIAAERIARRRRRLWIGGGLATAAAAATAAVVLALVLGSGGGSGLGGGTGTKRVAFTSTPRGIEIGAQLAARPWGSEISMQVRGIRPGTRCIVWVRGPHGRVSAGSFRYRYEGGSDAAGLSTSLRPDQARAIGVKAGNRTFVAKVA